METGFICKKISLGRHCTSEDVQLIQESFSRSPVKSKANASIELDLPKTAEWHVLRKILNLKPYKLPLLHAPCPDDHNKRYEFCSDMLEDRANEGFSERLGFFLMKLHLMCLVNCHNVRIWEMKNPCLVVQH